MVRRRSKLNQATHKWKIQESRSRKVFVVINGIFLTLVAFITLFPFIYIIAMSFSSYQAIARGAVLLLPVEFTFEGYSQVFEDGSIFPAYANTLFYTVVGTAVRVILTMAAAYPLSKKNYSLRGPIMVMITITMFFSGGMVPTYILMNQLHLYNTRWIIILLGAVSAYNLVMARVFLQSNIPEELAESAKLDGANDLQIFWKIVLPLSKAIIAVLSLFYGVKIWNDYYTALVYLQDSSLMPLSLYLRRLLILGTQNFNNIELELSTVLLDPVKINAVTERMKYCSIIVTMVPIMCVYPFFQKYFAKGVMVGALKD